MHRLRSAAPDRPARPKALAVRVANGPTRVVDAAAILLPAATSPANLPELTAAEGFVARQVREARTERGKLAYLSLEEEAALLAELAGQGAIAAQIRAMRPLPDKHEKTA